MTHLPPNQSNRRTISGPVLGGLVKDNIKSSACSETDGTEWSERFDLKMHVYNLLMRLTVFGGAGWLLCDV